jgi:hypothetical protein
MYLCMWPFASLSTVGDGHCVARARLGVSVTTDPSNRIQNISLCSRKFESEELLRLTAGESRHLGCLQEKRHLKLTGIGYGAYLDNHGPGRKDFAIFCLEGLTEPPRFLIAFDWLYSQVQALDYGKTVLWFVELAGGESFDIPPTWSDDYIGWNLIQKTGRNRSCSAGVATA